MKEMFTWTGPVHSGKSTKALLTAERFCRMGHKVVLARPEKSLRAHEEPGTLITKNGYRFPSIELTSAIDLLSLVGTEQPSVLWIDEPMLFEDEVDVFEIVMSLLPSVTLLVSGLTSTSELEVFGTSMSQLVAVADYPEHCRADCHRCGTLGTATRSFFTGGTKLGQVHIGGEEVYQALCPACWTTAVAEKKEVLAALRA